MTHFALNNMIVIVMTLFHDSQKLLAEFHTLRDDAVVLLSLQYM